MKITKKKLKQLIREAAASGGPDLMLQAAFRRLDASLGDARRSLRNEEPAEAAKWLKRLAVELDELEEILTGAGLLDSEWWSKGRAPDWASRWDDED